MRPSPRLLAIGLFLRWGNYHLLVCLHAVCRNGVSCCWHHLCRSRTIVGNDHCTYRLIASWIIELCSVPFRFWFCLEDQKEKGLFVGGNFPESEILASIRVYLLDGGGTLRALLPANVDAIDLESIEQLLQFDECGLLIVDLESETSSINDLQSIVAKHSSCVLTIAVSSAPELAARLDAMRSGCLTSLPETVTPETMELVCNIAGQLIADHQEVERPILRTISLLASLGTRERLILQHVRAGMTNREIANELGAGRRSVDRWRASVLEKIGAATTV
ncbi:MAG: FixJ family two-component response regulator, partial [Pirellulaceae bacterium]